MQRLGTPDLTDSHFQKKTGDGERHRRSSLRRSFDDILNKAKEMSLRDGSGATGLKKFDRILKCLSERCADILSEVVVCTRMRICRLIKHIFHRK